MVTMEELLASQKVKLVSLSRNQQVEGKIISRDDKEIILDLGAKSEGVIKTRGIPKDQLASLKIGDKIKAFVELLENESGQVSLSTTPSYQTRSGPKRKGGINWTKFIQAQNQKLKLNGEVLEINKGGLIVEVDGIRGFLPNSQVGFELMSKAKGGMEDLIGQDLSFTVIEIDQDNNRLIFSQRGQVSEDIKITLKNYKVNQNVSGKVVAILPFGLIVDVGGVEGIVLISDAAWEKVEDLSKLFNSGQEIEALVLGVDEELGRINLSLKHLTEDPFANLSEKYKGDDVVKGIVVEITGNGVLVKLEDGIEGFIPSSKMGSTQYEVGQQLTLLVDSVDKNRRRVNLAPMITSTAGLIYK